MRGTEGSETRDQAKAVMSPRVPWVHKVDREIVRYSVRKSESKSKQLAQQMREVHWYDSAGDPRQYGVLGSVSAKCNWVNCGKAKVRTMREG
jgi:hypothetical protein